MKGKACYFNQDAAQCRRNCGKAILSCKMLAFINDNGKNESCENDSCQILCVNIKPVSFIRCSLLDLSSVCQILLILGLSSSRNLYIPWNMSTGDVLCRPRARPTGVVAQVGFQIQFEIRPNLGLDLD